MAGNRRLAMLKTALIPSKPRKSSMSFWGKKDPVRLHKVVDTRVSCGLNHPYRVDLNVQGGGTKRNYNHSQWSILRYRANVKMARKYQVYAAPSEEALEEQRRHDLTEPPFIWASDIGWDVLEPIEDLLYEEMPLIPGDIAANRPDCDIKVEWTEGPFYKEAQYEHRKRKLLKEPKMPFTSF